MDTKGKITWTLGTVVSLFIIVGGLYTVTEILASEDELLVVAQNAARDTALVLQRHEADQVTAAEARKNERIDGIDKEIRGLKRTIEFGDPEQKTYNEGELVDLKTLKQNIIDGKR